MGKTKVGLLIYLPEGTMRAGNYERDREVH